MLKLKYKNINLINKNVLKKNYNYKKMIQILKYINNWNYK